MSMTNFMAGSFPDGVPEADVAYQSMPVAAEDEATLDTGYLADRRDAHVNDADLIDQAIDVPFAEDDRSRRRRPIGPGRRPHLSSTVGGGY
jgi:hypothetical protein